MSRKLSAILALTSLATAASSCLLPENGLADPGFRILPSDKLRKIVAKCYTSGESNTTILLKSVSSLPWPHLEVSGYEAIFEAINQNTNEARESAETFELAYYIKALESTPSKYQKLYESLRSRLAALKHKLPAAVKAIVFGGRLCSFKNKNFDTFLYAASDRFKFDNATRRVFVRTSGSSVAWPQEYWNLETLDEGKSWLIKSPQFGGEYLHAVIGLEGQADEDRRRTGTFKELKAGGAWRLKPEVGGRFVSILNTETSEYMYAGYNGFDDDRRHVYTWIPKGHSIKSDDQSLWQVRCPFE